VRQDSSVSLATRYGLEGPEIESLWGGEIFLILPDRPWGPPRTIQPVASRYADYPIPAHGYVEGADCPGTGHEGPEVE